MCWWVGRLLGEGRAEAELTGTEMGEPSGVSSGVMSRMRAALVRTAVVTGAVRVLVDGTACHRGCECELELKADLLPF